MVLLALTDIDLVDVVLETEFFELMETLRPFGVPQAQRSITLPSSATVFLTPLHGSL